MSYDMIQDVAKRAGLTVSVVNSLLNAGYSYTETIDAPPKWVQDSIKLVR